jgi:hypothetical protein
VEHWSSAEHQRNLVHRANHSAQVIARHELGSKLGAQRQRRGADQTLSRTLNARRDDSAEVGRLSVRKNCPIVAAWGASTTNPAWADILNASSDSSAGRGGNGARSCCPAGDWQHVGPQRQSPVTLQQQLWEASGETAASGQLRFATWHGAMPNPTKPATRPATRIGRYFSFRMLFATHFYYTLGRAVGLGRHDRFKYPNLRNSNQVPIRAGGCYSGPL